MQQKSIFRNFIYKLMLNFFNIIVPVFLSSYISRVLGKTSLGNVIFADRIQQFFLIFASCGIYSYGLRELSKLRDDKTKLKSTFSSLLIINSITTACTLFIYILFILFNSDSRYNTSLLLVFSISLFSNLFFVEWANEALENYKFITFKAIIIKIIYIVSLLLLIKGPKDYIVYAIILALTPFLNNIVSFTSIIRNIGVTLKDIEFKKHLPSLVMALIMANGNFLYTQLDILFLGSTSGADSVSNYTQPMNIVCMVNALIMSVIFVSLPRLSSLLSDNNEAGYKTLLNKSFNSLCVFLFPNAVGIFVLGKEIMLLYGGAQFLDAVPLIKLFTLYMITTAFDAVIAYQIIYAKRREKTLICFILTCGLTNLAIKIILLKLNILTPLTAIATTIICNTILISIEYIYSVKVLKTKVNIFKYSNLKYLLISIPFIPISCVIKGFVTSTVFIALITVLTCSAFYFLVLVIIRDEVVMTVLNKFINKYFSLSKKDKAL